MSEVVMTGVFGDNINNRSDFFRELARAKKLAEDVLKRFGGDRSLQAVHTQLEAIEQWASDPDNFTYLKYRRI